MSSTLILLTVAIYSAMLFAVVWFTSRKTNNESYFIGNRSSNWFLVAYGMIGASLSGVTFMSVPGAVFTSQFSYFQMVLGYILGYMIIAFVLMPVYYKLQLTSIYTYLEQRFGKVSYKTGSMFFIISRVIGASFRMYIVINVLQTFVFDALHVPFWVTVLVFILLILLYTYEGGVKTIVITDTLQTTFMLIALLSGIWIILSGMNISLGDFFSKLFSIANADGVPYSKIVVTDFKASNFALKHFLGGAAIAVAMTGLDQEMMQKNLSCRNIREAQKNMMTFTAVLVVVNFLFLILGAALCMHAGQHGLTIDPKHTDDLFPSVALNHWGAIPAIIFLVGLISAAYPSADGALTALTTAFCFDFLELDKNKKLTEANKKRARYIVHVTFALVLLLTIVIFKLVNNDAVISSIFKAATLTYGPLLGLYVFGFFTKYKIRDSLVWIPCILSPIICYLISNYSAEYLLGYKIGFELLIVNAGITFLGLLMLKKSNH
ncbi:MAG: sodium:solute symporter [Bacteroidetes bacterium]|nr:sodium:solute symporter [Bacteroidota bacterium]